ncbi:MAG TPA: hypothetical protein VFA37_01945 [Gaiellaceae bacterium]|nr:hypothetical protein [Gaiellaceae bacterium]
MRMRAFVFVLIAGALVVTGSSLRRAAAAATAQSPAVFVSALPEIGTVYARYDCTSNRSLRFALGIRYSRQSGVVRFRAGRFSRDREVQPGPTAWFPYRPSQVEWLAAAAGGENGVVVGWVRVIGYGAHAGKSCSAYDPPRVTVQIYPRTQNYDENSGRYLRLLIG